MLFSYTHVILHTCGWEIYRNIFIHIYYLSFFNHLIKDIIFKCYFFNCIFVEDKLNNQNFFEILNNKNYKT
jgi:hypothetical protein